ncbi:MAG: ABC transporter permease [Eubacteriales bacterium]
MNVFKRGLISIVRRPGKSVILLVLILVLSNIIAGAISVKNALVNTEDAILEKMGVEVTIIEDWDAIRYIGGVVPSITPEMVETIGQSEYVKEYDYSTTYYLEARDVKNYYSDYYYDGNGSFTLIGGQNTTLKDVRSGDITIKEGRAYTQEEIESGAPVLLISDKVAQLNGLSVGSTITFLYTLYDNSVVRDYAAKGDGDFNIPGLPVEPWEPKVIKTFEFEFKVIGIFSAKPMRYTDWNGNIVETDSPLLNTVYTVNKATNACINEIQKEAQAAGVPDNVYINTAAVFILRHPDDVELFESQNKQHLPKGLVFKNNAKSFESIRTPMANVEWIAEIVMWVAVGATVLIISLLVTLFLRDRRHEMGIYLALGARKGAIVTQILTEVLVVALIAVTLSVFTGNLLASNMSATMLENQLTEEQKNEADGGHDVIPFRDISVSSSKSIGILPVPIEEEDTGQITTEDVMEMYKVRLDLKTVLFIYLIGMGSVLVSTLVPIIYTLRLKPRQILM